MTFIDRCAATPLRRRISTIIVGTIAVTIATRIVKIPWGNWIAMLVVVWIVAFVAMLLEAVAATHEERR